MRSVAPFAVSTYLLDIPAYGGDVVTTRRSSISLREGLKATSSVIHVRARAVASALDRAAGAIASPAAGTNAMEDEGR